MAITINWAAEWLDKSSIRIKPDSLTDWNKRSKEFAKHSGKSDYAKIFMEYLDLLPGQTVFDMGCGAGAICVPLAKLGHKVIAADFSEGMLEAAAKHAKIEGVTDLISFKKLAWEDNWEAAGIEPKSVDIAVASRSTIVNDLNKAFEKITSIARNKVCVTLATDNGPRNFKDIATNIGREPHKQSDFIYGINLLIQLGYDPELRYIDSLKKERFESREDAVAYFDEYFAGLTAAENAELQAYLDKHLIEQSQEAEFRYQLDKGRLIRWAFIAWKTDQTTRPRW